MRWISLFQKPISRETIFSLKKMKILTTQSVTSLSAKRHGLDRQIFLFMEPHVRRQIRLKGSEAFPSFFPILKALVPDPFQKLKRVDFATIDYGYSFFCKEFYGLINMIKPENHNGIVATRLDKCIHIFNVNFSLIK